MKNLKMFAIALLAMLVMVSGVHAAEENPCGSDPVYATINGKVSCYASLSAALSAVTLPDDGDTVKVEIKYYDDENVTAALTLSQPGEYVIDLNGKTVDFKTSFAGLAVGEDQSLTIKSSNGTGDITTNVALLKVTDNGKLTIEKDVKITASGSDAVIAVTGTDDAEAAPVINLAGEITSSASAAVITISDIATLNVTGGKLKSTANNQYVVTITPSDEEKLATLKISGGEFEVKSTNSSKNVINITAQSDKWLEANKGNVTGGTFKYGLIGNITVNGGNMPVDTVLNTLIGEGNYTKAKNGTVTVTPKATQEPEPQQPGTTEPGDQTTGDGNQGGTDNVQNPNTNDNILVYAGLGLVSLAFVAFTAKKRED